MIFNSKTLTALYEIFLELFRMLMLVVGMATLINDFSGVKINYWLAYAIMVFCSIILVSTGLLKVKK